LHNTSETVLLNAKAVLRISAMNTVDEFVTEARQQPLNNWRSKALHGEFLKKVNGGELSLSFNWMVKGRLKMPTEAQIVAAQDQALQFKVIFMGYEL